LQDCRIAGLQDWRIGCTLRQVVRQAPRAFPTISPHPAILPSLQFCNPAILQSCNSMIILDSLLIGSLRFVLDKIVAAAEAEANDDTALREQLLEAQMRLELGEITESEFVSIEREVVARLRELKGSQQGALTMTSRDRIAGVDVESYKDH
jgi:hypothetical protein